MVRKKPASDVIRADIGLAQKRLRIAARSRSTMATNQLKSAPLVGMPAA
jgi:hypothetical protein